MADKLPIDLPATTVGNKVVHGVNTDNTTDSPQGTSEQVTVNTPLSLTKYVDSNTSKTARDGSIENPYISTTEARLDITDNLISKQYSLVVIKDDGSSNTAKPYIYQRGENRVDFTGGAVIPNIAGRYEYSNMTLGNVNTDNLTVAAEMVFTDCDFLAASLIFTISTTTPATAKFIRCTFGGKMDFRQVDAEFIDCDISAMEFIDGTLTAKTWKFNNCRIGGAMTTSGSSSGCNFDFIGCHWLSSSSLSSAWPMLVTCDSTFPHESNAQVTIVSMIADSVVVEYDNTTSGLTADNVQDAIDEVAVFGMNYQYEADEAESTTTSTTFINKLTLTTPSIPAGDYRIEATLGITNDSADKPVEFQAVIDGTPPFDAGSYAPKFADEYFFTSGFGVSTLTAGIHTIDIEFSATSEGGTAKARNARIEIYRVL